MKYALLLNNKLASILRDHQIPLTERKHYIHINGTDVQMQALGYPNKLSTSVNIQLDVNIRSKRYLKNHELTESFAENGANLDEAIQKAFLASASRACTRSFPSL